MELFILNAIQLLWKGFKNNVCIYVGMYVVVHLMWACSYHSVAGNEAAEKVHYSSFAHDRRVWAFERGHGDGIVTRATVAETLHLAALVWKDEIWLIDADSTISVKLQVFHGHYYHPHYYHNSYHHHYYHDCDNHLHKLHFVLIMRTLAYMYSETTGGRSVVVVVFRRQQQY